MPRYGTCRRLRRPSALSHQYKEVYAAVGIHPEDAASATPEGFEQIRQWLKTEPKVVAIGEVGLDYYWPEPSHEIQQEVFIEHIKMALSLTYLWTFTTGKPRRHDGPPAKIRQGDAGRLPLLFGELEMAEELIKMGYYIGFTGTMVFPKSTKLKRIAAELPIDRILIETDCPYLTPPPYRGKRNEPAYVQYVADEIARLRGMTTEEVRQITLENGKRIFGITVTKDDAAEDQADAHR